MGNRSGRLTPVFESSVGVIRIEGAIADSEDTVKLIRRFRNNSMIKALVLRIDSPGGGVAASEEIYREVLKARHENEMPVVVSMGSVAASGGYYIAAAADQIYATSGTITGSLGVVAPMFNIRETLDKIGVRTNPIVSGEHKNAGDPFSEPTPQERALLQGLVYDMYRQFFQVVLAARYEAIGEANRRGDIDAIVAATTTKNSTNSLEIAAFPTGAIARPMGVPVETETALRKLADGRVFSGEQALKVGLVDAIGTLQDAIDYAGEMAGLPSDPPTVDRNPKSSQPGWLGAYLRQALHEAARPTQAIEFRAPY